MRVQVAAPDAFSLDPVALGRDRPARLLGHGGSPPGGKLLTGQRHQEFLPNEWQTVLP